jgi:predicted secreted protein
VTARGRPVLRLDGTRYVPATARRLGAPGRYVARFTVRAAGRASIALVYVRRTRPASASAARFRLVVVSARR